MTKEEIFVVVKSIISESIAKSNPVQYKETSKLKGFVENNITPESPLSTLGWDSLQMTWLLLEIENKLKIDTSTISLFDLYTIDDFLTELQKLVKQNGV